MATSIPPTTLIPTTLAPTTVAPTPAPTTPPPSDPTKSTWYNCAYKGTGNIGQGILYFNVSLDGEFGNEQVDAETLEFGFDIDGNDAVGEVIEPETLEFSFKFQEYGDTDHSNYISIGGGRRSFVKWSRIGYLDFTIDHSNEAGEGFISNIGTIHGQLKLGNGVIVYGSKGIAKMIPAEVAWGHKFMSNMGVMSRESFVGNDDIHWYINSDGDLCKVTDSVKRIGYKEFLSTLTDPVMLLDKRRFLIYICDGTTGYVYSHNDQSLCEGSPNISGFDYTVDGDEIVCSPETIPDLSITFITDTFDMGTRKEKTILSLQMSTDLSENIEAAIEYRLALDGAFASTPWVTFTPHGVAYIPCYGIEFRIKVRVQTYTQFEIDQLTINGIIHGAGYLDYQGGYYVD